MAISTPSLDPLAEAVLRAAGWHPGRRVDTSHFAAALRAECGWLSRLHQDELDQLVSRLWHPAARNFVGEFDELVLRVPPRSTDRSSRAVSFGSRYIGLWPVDSPSIAGIIRQHGEGCPVGHESGGDMDLFVCEDGVVMGYWSGGPRIVVSYGRAPQEAIEALVLDRATVVLKEV